MNYRLWRAWFRRLGAASMILGLAWLPILVIFGPPGTAYLALLLISIGLVLTATPRGEYGENVEDGDGGTA